MLLRLRRWRLAARRASSGSDDVTVAGSERAAASARRRPVPAARAARRGRDGAPSGWHSAGRDGAPAGGAQLPCVSWHGRALAPAAGAGAGGPRHPWPTPHIARPLDAGVTSEGHPYLALEYVEGRPIDVHAREAGLLRSPGGWPSSSRILGAAAHAHGRLVVHRDLKPSNVLVTADATGAAPGLRHRQAAGGWFGRQTELTQLAGPAFTPNYASPESARRRPHRRGERHLLAGGSALRAAHRDPALPSASRATLVPPRPRCGSWSRSPPQRGKPPLRPHDARCPATSTRW